MQTINLTAGQTTDFILAPGGARVSLSGSGYIKFAPGTIQEAKEGRLTFKDWPLASTAGFCDLARPVVLYAVGTGDCTVTIDQVGGLANDDEVYWVGSDPIGDNSATAMPVNATIDPVTGRVRKLANGQFVDMAQISSKKIPTLGAIGDSIIERNLARPTLPGLVGSVYAFSPHLSFVDKACYLLGGLIVPDAYAVEGYSGQQTHEILESAKSKSATVVYGVSDTIKYGIAARSPTITLELSGTNDANFSSGDEIKNGVALRRCVAGRRAIWAYIRACGSEPLALSLLPCQGSWAGSDMTQEQLKPYRPIWNAALKAAAEADGVAWADIYTPCASVDGGWKPDYIKHEGADDVGGVHPMSLAVEAIALAIKPVLANMIGAAPYVPRLELGNSAIYSAPFANDGLRQYFANFDTGLFPSLSGWSVRYNPQSAGSQSIALATQDISGGGTYQAQITSSGSNVFITTGPQISVAAGQEYLFFADVDSDQSDIYTGASISIADVTSGSGSLWQPLRDFNLMAEGVPSPIRTGVRRVIGSYLVPTGINRVAVQLQFSTTGTGGGVSSMSISNIGQLRLA